MSGRVEAAGGSGRPVLCIGGLDPSGGAGLIADARAVRAAGSFALTAAAALTAQSSSRVFAVRAVSSGWLRSQIEALEKESSFGAVKTGFLGSGALIEDLASWYRAAGTGPLVVDPVMVAGDGTPLLEGASRTALLRALLPLASLVTPNRLEAELLSGHALRSAASMERAARQISEKGPSAVLVKGGHFPGAPRDLLWEAGTNRMTWLPPFERRPGRWHGLGCHLAAAVAARLALGDPLSRAVSAARSLLARGMENPRITPSGRRVPSWGRSEG